MMTIWESVNNKTQIYEYSMMYIAVSSRRFPAQDGSEDTVYTTPWILKASSHPRAFLLSQLLTS
jgi:hypothetical protein